MNQQIRKESVCEEKVFLEVHKTHAVALRNFLFYKFGDLEKAKDFAQDAFAKLWDNCKKVDLDKVKSYLFTIGNRLFLDHYDHQQVVLKFQRRQDMETDYTETNPEYLYRHEEFKNRLEEAISALPEKQRTVFLMNRIDKMSYQEIAERLELNIKTVEKHVSAALKTLKSGLDELKSIKI